MKLFHIKALDGLDENEIIEIEKILNSADAITIFAFRRIEVGKMQYSQMSFRCDYEELATCFFDYLKKFPEIGIYMNTISQIEMLNINKEKNKNDENMKVKEPKGLVT